MVVRIRSRVWGSLGFGLLSQAGASRTQKARSSGRVPNLKVDIDLQLKVQEVAPVDVDDRDCPLVPVPTMKAVHPAPKTRPKSLMGSGQGLQTTPLSFLICPSRQFLRALARHAKLRF